MPLPDGFVNTASGARRGVVRLDNATLVIDPATGIVRVVFSSDDQAGVVRPDGVTLEVDPDTGILRSKLAVTDGTDTVANVAQLAVSGARVAGTTPDAEIIVPTLAGGTGISVNQSDDVWTIGNTGVNTVFKIVDYTYNGSEPTPYNIDVPSGFTHLTFWAYIIGSGGHNSALILNGTNTLVWSILAGAAARICVFTGTIPFANVSGYPIVPGGVLYSTYDVGTGANQIIGGSPIYDAGPDGPIATIGWELAGESVAEGSRLIVYGWL
jgi:hypothetical protein